MIQLKNITKTYFENGVHALRGVSLMLKRGEICTILGENGAGKSTLAGIVGGFIKPDSGSILIDGSERQFSSPESALKAGVGVIRQRPLFVDELSIWENCILGIKENGINAVLLNKKTARKKVYELSEKLTISISIDKKAGQLSIAEKKKAAVISLLLRGAGAVIFDEPLSYLEKKEKESILSLILSLKKQNTAVAVISHESEELLLMSSKLIVLRKGEISLALDKKPFNAKQISDAVFGGDVVLSDSKNKTFKPNKTNNEKCLSIKNISVKDARFFPLDNVSFDAAKGEIKEIKGTKENGAETLLAAILGFVNIEKGEIKIDGGCSNIINNIAYLGQDIPDLASPFSLELSLRDNILLFAHRDLSKKKGLLKPSAAEKFALSILEDARISAFQRKAYLTLPASALSGGMLSRVLASREFAKNAKVLVISNAAAGLDTRSENALFDRIKKFAENGGAVIAFLGHGDFPFNANC